MWYYAKDGQQVGPVSREDLQALLENQTILRDTNVWRDGMAQWAPANQVPELTAGLSAGMVSQPMPGSPYQQMPTTNGIALTSMILGICGIIIAPIVASIPAIICGHIARGQIRKAAGMQTGDGMALAGLITGYLMTLLTTMFIVLFVVLAIYSFNEASSSSGRRLAPPAPTTFPTPTPTPSPVPVPAPAVPGTP